METHVAVLRGINLGGRNRVPLAELREVVAALRHTGVAMRKKQGLAGTARNRAAATRLLSLGGEQ